MSFNHDKRHLPSLRAISAVEAAARLGSFTEAAHELHVTQGAISRQVQELERLLGVDLFTRTGPKLRLTDTGRTFAQSMGRLLDDLNEAMIVVQGRQEVNYVTLSMLPSVATKWLAPRLDRLINKHPDIDLRVSASRQLVNFDAEGIDAAIRYGKGKWPGLNAELLIGETVFPVCSPAYAEKKNLVTPSSLTDATLFHAEIDEDWASWFAAAGISNVKIPRGPTLGDYAAILQAAIDSQGIALGRSVLVADDLAAGRLIAPFDISLKASCSYWFVTPSKNPELPNLIAIKKWVEDEFHRTR